MSFLGKKHSLEVRQKMSIIAKGRTNLAMYGPDNPMYGKHHTKEAKLKISLAHKGKKRGNFTLEHRNKISKALLGEKNAMFGKKHKKSTLLKMRVVKLGDKNSMWHKEFSKEHRMKISIAHKGKKIPRDAIEKMILSKKGFKHTEATRKIMSLLQIGKNNSFYDKKHSKEAKRKMSLIHSGEKHHNYIHGKGYYPYSIEFQKIKKMIRRRDNYICQNCGITEEEHIKKIRTVLHVHHIDYDKDNCNVLNLITLCRECNIKANYNREYWREKFNSIINNKYLFN